MAKRYYGSCLCGAVTFEADGEPLRVVNCHCPSCRKASGAPFATFVDYEVSKVKFEGETYTKYRSSPGVERGFCSRCGTSLSFEGGKWPGEIDLFVGAFEHPEQFAPDRHLYTLTKMPWLKFADNLPAHEKWSG